MDKCEKATSQQDSKAPCQPYVDLTKGNDSETPQPMRTLQHLDPDHEAATQQEMREAHY
jgi:hypothetical protein